jgi:amino acid adenylation domain-containing protein
MGYLLQHLLRDSAARDRAKEAVRMGGSAMTFGELDRRTNQLAWALRRLGVQRGDRVGIFVPKSFASVVSVFAVLKAGGVYVPLDPGAPAARLTYILRDCGIKVLISSPQSIGRLQEIVEADCQLRAVVFADETATGRLELTGPVPAIPWSAVAEESDAELTPAGTIDSDLAYILYTSGSTGVPKGVMIAHRTIATFVDWSCAHFAVTSDDRVTSYAPLHFDLSTFDLFVTMKAGGTIILIGEHLAALPEQLAALLHDEKVTITYLVPSILSLMVRYGRLSERDFSALRLILFAGEVFPLKYLRQLMGVIAAPQYHNLYGPTETNVCTSYHVAAEDVAADRTQPVPIGEACANSEVFALDERGERVTEPGVEGELWARGSCVAQGYWGDPEKTAKGFVQNPLNMLFRDIAYRTGDIVTLAPDRRNWLFVGRRDHMIKSRGYRIELGEIESALYRHEQVKEAAVVAIPDDILGSRLRAFVVVTDRECVTPKQLMIFCSKHLPKYMIPEAVEFCAVLPKTSSGKVDRPALLQRTVAPSLT